MMPAQFMSNVGGFLGKVFQQIDIFGLMDDDTGNKDKKKKAKLNVIPLL